MSFFTLIKPNQGKWTRIITGGALGVLIVSFGLFLQAQLAGHGDYLPWSIAGAVIIALAVFSWWIMNKPTTVDFLIATDSEMRKVNWPSTKELVGSTWVVICGTFLMAISLFIVDMLFGEFFYRIGVLEGASLLGSLLEWLFGAG